MASSKKRTRSSEKKKKSKNKEEKENNYDNQHHHRLDFDEVAPVPIIDEVGDDPKTTDVALNVVEKEIKEEIGGEKVVQIPTQKKSNKKKRKKEKIPPPPTNDPDAPKLPKKGWQIYVEKKRDKFMKDNPNIKYGETTKQLKQQFDTLQPTARNQYLKLALQDKLRYRKEIENYKLPEVYSSQEKEQSKKRKRGSDAPRGPRQASRIYWEEKKLEFIARYPRHTPKERNQEITRSWTELGSEKQKPYIEKAKREESQYNAEIKRYLIKQQKEQSKTHVRTSKEESDSLVPQKKKKKQQK